MKRLEAKTTTFSKIRKNLKGEYVAAVVALLSFFMIIARFLLSFFYSGRLFLYDVNMVNIPYFDSLYFWILIGLFVGIISYILLYPFIIFYKEKKTIKFLVILTIEIVVFIICMFLFIHIYTLLPIRVLIQNFWTIMFYSILILFPFLGIGIIVSTPFSSRKKHNCTVLFKCFCVFIIGVAVLAFYLFFCGEKYEEQRTDFKVITFDSEEYAVVYELKDSLIISPILSFMSDGNQFFTVKGKGSFIVENKGFKTQHKTFVSRKNYNTKLMESTYSKVDSCISPTDANDIIK